MIFGRKSREQRVAEEPARQDTASTGPALLRDELGLHHLWYLELRLQHEAARAARAESVFSLCCWSLRLLPGEPTDAAMIAGAADYVVSALRTFDLVSRIDDARFVGLLFDADYNNACTVAFRIKGELQRRFPSVGRWEAGVATYGRDGTEGQDLIQAMLEACEGDTRAA